MRIATLIIGLILSVVAGIQAIVVFTASSVSDSLSNYNEATGKFEGTSSPSADTSGGAVGSIGAFVMFIGAAFALAKPKVAKILFAVAAGIFLLAGIAGSGYSDAWIWAVANVVLALFSWRGEKELVNKREREREAYREDVAAAAAAIAKHAG
jgi:hypothetical protein